MRFLLRRFGLPAALAVAFAALLTVASLATFHAPQTSAVGPLVEMREWEARVPTQRAAAEQAVREAHAALEAFTAQHDLPALDAAILEQSIICEQMVQELDRLETSGHDNHASRVLLAQRLQGHRRQRDALRAVREEYDRLVTAVDEAREAVTQPSLRLLTP